MQFPSFSTTEDTSEVASRVREAISESRRSAIDTRKIAELVARIRDLEARGFIVRQSYHAPTTIEFEQRIANLF